MTGYSPGNWNEKKTGILRKTVKNVWEENNFIPAYTGYIQAISASHKELLITPTNIMGLYKNTQYNFVSVKVFVSVFVYIT